MWLARLLVQISEAALFAYLYFWLRSLDPAFDEAAIARLFCCVLALRCRSAWRVGRWSDRRGQPMAPLRVGAAVAAGSRLAAMALSRRPGRGARGLCLLRVWRSTVFLSLHRAQTSCVCCQSRAPRPRPRLLQPHQHRAVADHARADARAGALVRLFARCSRCLAALALLAPLILWPSPPTAPPLALRRQSSGKTANDNVHKERFERDGFMTERCRSALAAAACWRVASAACRQPRRETRASRRQSPATGPRRAARRAITDPATEAQDRRACIARMTRRAEGRPGDPGRHQHDHARRPRALSARLDPRRRQQRPVRQRARRAPTTGTDGRRISARSRSSPRRTASRSRSCSGSMRSTAIATCPARRSFPHNIGLGAARDPGADPSGSARATAAEIAGSGIEWTFAPTLAVPQDLRWGRTYEGYASDPALVAAYAAAMVLGLQGPLDRGRPLGPHRGRRHGQAFPRRRRHVRAARTRAMRVDDRGRARSPSTARAIRRRSTPGR